jgi:hypothetical protein
LAVWKTSQQIKRKEAGQETVHRELALLVEEVLTSEEA